MLSYWFISIISILVLTFIWQIIITTQVAQLCYYSVWAFGHGWKIYKNCIFFEKVMKGTGFLIQAGAIVPHIKSFNTVSLPSLNMCLPSRNIATLGSILDSQLSWDSGKFQLARWSHELVWLCRWWPPTQPPTHPATPVLAYLSTEWLLNRVSELS